MIPRDKGAGTQRRNKEEVEEELGMRKIWCGVVLEQRTLAMAGVIPRHSQ